MKILRGNKVRAPPCSPARRVGLTLGDDLILREKKSKLNYRQTVVCQVNCFYFKMDTLKCAFFSPELQSYTEAIRKSIYIYMIYIWYICYRCTSCQPRMLLALAFCPQSGVFKRIQYPSQAHSNSLVSVEFLRAGWVCLAPRFLVASMDKFKLT